MHAPNCGRKQNQEQSVEKSVVEVLSENMSENDFLLGKLEKQSYYQVFVKQLYKRKLVAMLSLVIVSIILLILFMIASASSASPSMIISRVDFEFDGYKESEMGIRTVLDVSAGVHYAELEISHFEYDLKVV